MELPILDLMIKNQVTESGLSSQQEHITPDHSHQKRQKCERTTKKVKKVRIIKQKSIKRCKLNQDSCQTSRDRNRSKSVQLALLTFRSKSKKRSQSPVAVKEWK